MPSDIVLDALDEAKDLLDASLRNRQNVSSQRLMNLIRSIELAQDEYKRKTDLHRTIAETIRTEIRHEMEGRRDVALQHFALTMGADEKVAN